MRSLSSLSLFAAVMVLLWVSGSAVSASPEGLPISFTTSDGVKIGGRLFGSGRTGVVLGHMFPVGQETWWPFSKYLATKGYTALTFDFRGYPASGGKQDIAVIDRDMEAAYLYLKPKVDRVALVGASMGGMAALVVAARQPVAGVIAVSAPTQFRGFDALAVVGRVTAPKLFIASSGDGSAPQSVDAFMKAAKGSKQQKIFPGEAHGVFIFDTDNSRAFTDLMVQFLAGLE